MKTSYHGLSVLVALLFTVNATNAQNSLTPSPKTEINETKNPLKDFDLAKIATAESRKQNKVVAITGVRFAYPLVQKWIDDYYKINPEVQIIIEPRGMADPSKYCIFCRNRD